MSSDQKKSEERQAAINAIAAINAVEGFDPAPLADEYTDLNTKESRSRLPVMAQLAWFRLKYPEGRIAISVTSAKDCFVATAKVYHHFTDPVDQFLAEATASRGYLADKPTVSPREWAQTAAVGIALRNAGFGLQFGAAGDAFDDPAVDELSGITWSDEGAAPFAGPAAPASAPQASRTSAPAEAAPPPPQPQESPLEQAMKQPCPIAKYSGKTLGDIIQLDPKALVWVATKYTGDQNIIAAAKLICDQALQESA